MAAGGDIGHFCSEARQHQDGCEYYMADGGSVEVPGDDLPQATPPVEVPQEDLPEEAAAQEVPQEDLPTDYTSSGQQAIAGVEGAAQGYLGPLATGAELIASKAGIPGFAEEDIAGRASQPIHAAGEALGLTAGLLTGTGEAGLVVKAANKAIPLGSTVLRKIGSMALKGALENGTIQGFDEISKGLLGQGSPEAPYAAALSHMGAAGVLGSAAGGLFGSVGAVGSKGLEALQNSKWSGAASDFLEGMGRSARAREFPEMPGFVEATEGPMADRSGAFKAGHQAAENLFSRITRAPVDLAGEKVGGMVGGPLGKMAGAYTADKVLGPLSDKVFGGAVNKYLAPGLLRALQSGSPEAAPAVVRFTNNVAKGATKLNNGLDGLFRTGGQQSVNFFPADKEVDKIKEFMEQGGVDNQVKNQIQAEPSPQPFAEGGQVVPTAEPGITSKKDHLSQVLPDQGALLAASKGRISTYLNTLRPNPHKSKLPFDVSMEDPETERRYHKAVSLAAQPLSILSHIKQGTVEPEHVHHFTSMFPELHDHLSKQMTERISKSQMVEEQPEYHVRQGMSLFLGTPLDSTMTPQNIQAAQAIYVPQQPTPAQSAPKKPKKDSKGLTKLADSFKTSDQAAQSRETAS